MNSEATYEQILNNLKKHIELTEDEKELFTSVLKEKKVFKKTLILRAGEICKHINFVNSGTLRAYYTNSDGKESTIMFAATDWWITDMFCFVNRQSAMLNVEAVDDSHIWQLDKLDLDRLFVSIPKLEKFFRIIMQNAYIREQLRVIQNLSQTAEERYDNFIHKYPHIVQQVPQKQIATYLGITPEFLSAIRSNKKK